MADYSDEEIILLKGKILGTELDSAKSAFVTSGPASKRNDLQTDEKIITRAINVGATTSNTALDTANGFKDRFDLVIGNEVVADKEAFDSIRWEFVAGYF